jgi:hypothetical protein
MKRIIKLTPEQEKVYKQMKHLALAEMEGKHDDNSYCLNSTYETSTN